MGQVAADGFRRDHHLGTQPLGDLVAMIEQATGIDVAVVDAAPDQHGLTMRDPVRDAVFIAVARTPHPMRQRSTLAHELAHVLFEDWTTPHGGALNERGLEEVRADAFARHLLVPIEGLREVLGRRDDVGPAILSAVVQRFLVSPPIAAIALHQAGYIRESTKAEWMAYTTPTLAARFGWLDQYYALQGDSDQRRAPQRLVSRAIEGYLHHVVSAQAIATLRSCDVATIESELSGAGIVPDEGAIAWADPADLPDVDLDLSDLDEATHRDPTG